MRKEGGNIEAKRGLQYFTLFPVNKSWEIEEKEERKKYKRKKDEKEENYYGNIRKIKNGTALWQAVPATTGQVEGIRPAFRCHSMVEHAGPTVYATTCIVTHKPKSFFGYSPQIIQFALDSVTEKR